MININNISFSYGEKQIFKDFSLNIEAGKRICLFGESGSGKTTLLHLILGLKVPQEGSIRISGTPSVVFQEDRLLPFKTVLENILLVGAEEKTALQHLAALGISDTKDKYPRTLSGGMNRRAALARALSFPYDFLILDEPFAGLDERNIQTAAHYISEQLGSRSLILVSHAKKEAELLDAEIFSLP